MEDETLTNVLRLLQNTNNNNQQTQQQDNKSVTNNDIQTLLIKFLLSGGLTQILNFFSQKNGSTDNSNTLEKTRTIDLKNYQRID